MKFFRIATMNVKMLTYSMAQWCTPIIPVFGRLRQVVTRSNSTKTKDLGSNFAVEGGKKADLWLYTSYPASVQFVNYGNSKR